jgi:hypothetical protein
MLPNQSMKSTAPFAKQLQRACHDTVAWLISFSLGAYASQAQDR